MTANPVTAWNGGATRIRAFLSKHGFSTDELAFESLASTIDVMRPFGDWVGVKESDDEPESTPAQATTVPTIEAAGQAAEGEASAITAQGGTSHSRG
eukprot:5719642-Prymnesium_polylepis.1